MADLAEAETVVLDDVQFGKILDDAAPDQVLFRLAYSGFESNLPHSFLVQNGKGSRFGRRFARRVVRASSEPRARKNSLAGLAQLRTSLADS